jgi:23S rRNA (cytosine1962-C5)-methyltransferase
MSNINDVKQSLIKNSLNLTNEFKRLFNGRGGVYVNFKFLTIDSIDDILSIAFYKECEQNIQDELLRYLKDFILTSRHTSIILQRRYNNNNSTELLYGTLKENIYAIENGLQFKLNIFSNQNSGYFPDMKKGREFIQSIAKNKKVLNLFSYTCGFSISAIKGEAAEVINIDMAKGALTTGRTNHQINNLSTQNVKFLPHNILKSFGKIKRLAPYDIIIIDPPTFQKGSFEASKDYNKIINKLENISTKDTIVLACLNSPDLTSDFIIDIFKKEAPLFTFKKRLDNVSEFECIDENRSLKNLVFTRD